MAITTVDDIAAALAAGAQRTQFYKTFAAPKAAGAFQSGWLGTGEPVTGAASVVYTNGSAYTADKSTAGAMRYRNGVTQNWLAKAGAQCNVVGAVILADRLWSCSGMGFAATTYTVTTPGSLPARITDNGVDCELWVEQFVAAGAASGTLTATYVEPGGATGHTGVIPAVVSAPVIGQMQLVPLAAGDGGIKSLTSVANSATWTSGTWGMTILKRLAELPLPVANAMTTYAWDALLQKIPADACLMLIYVASSTTAPVIYAPLTIVDK